MNDMYKVDELCMEFTNKEIVDYFIRPLENLFNVKVKLSSYNVDNISSDSNEKIRYITLIGTKEDFTIHFYDFLTAVFLFEEEFMFIDDEAKKTTVSSDTYHNVVYEGYLRDKTHKEILSIIYELVTILYGAEKIKIEEEQISQIGFQYPKCKYIVRLTKPNEEKRHMEFENILFLIN